LPLRGTCSRRSYHKDDDAAALTLASGEILHHLKLDLLNFGQPLPLPVDQMVEFLMQVPDLELGFEIDAIVVLGP